MQPSHLSRPLGLALLLAGLAATAAPIANAQTVITRFNFNSNPADANIATGTASPSIGSGSVAVIGGATSTFGSGDVNGGSSDPATGDDSGFQTTGYPAQGANNETAGLRINVSTAGFQNILFTYDLRHSNTSSRFESIAYSLDGTNFIRLTLSSANASGGVFGPNGTFSGPAGDTWFNARTVNFTGIPGVENNPLFAVRVTAAQEANGAYLASSDGAAGTYAGGTWRFDQVTISSVPEPSTYALLAAGAIGAIGFSLRRRRPTA